MIVPAGEGYYIIQHDKSRRAALATSPVVAWDVHDTTGDVTPVVLGKVSGPVLTPRGAVISGRKYWATLADYAKERPERDLPDVAQGGGSPPDGPPGPPA